MNLNLPPSPTASDMRPTHTRQDSLGVLTSSDEFTINRDLIREWWNDWYVSTKYKPSTSIPDKPHSYIPDKPSTSSPNIETNPIFKVPEFSRENYPKLSAEFSQSSDLLDKINQELSKLNISRGEVSTRLTRQDWHPHKRNFYSKPRGVFDGSSIIAWNLDGMAEEQIYNLLQKMGIAVTAYKLKGAGDKQSATMLIAGFTGNLKNWWNNYLTDGDKNAIQNSATTKMVVKTEGGMERSSEEIVEDATTTLLYCIAKNFIGEPKLFQDRNLEILNNLYCKRLTDFRWYKDMFLSKVMIRPDCSNDYWKERFLSGLPSLFAEKVRTKIRDRYNGKIPYPQLSYGDLIRTINMVATDLCTDLKLEEQLKKDPRKTAHELESFCQDFGFAVLKPPSARKPGKKERRGKYND